jgi:hypothetical protein
MVETRGSRQRKIVACSTTDENPLRTWLRHLDSGAEFRAGRQLSETLAPALRLRKYLG